MKKLLTALVLCATTPALAQDRMNAEQCVQSWDATFGLTGLPVAQLQVDVDPSGWCLIQEGTFTINGGTRIRLDRLTWRASEIERLIDEGLPPRSIEIYGEGLGVLPQTGDPVYDYILSLQSQDTGFGFGVSVRWDGVQNAVLIDDGYVVFDDENRIDVTGRVDGLDLTDLASIQTSVGTMGLRNLSVKATFSGWFESYFALPLGLSILTDGPVSPEQQVLDMQREVVDFTSDIPETILPDVARDAFAAFVTDLPTPRGTLQVQINADPIIGAQRLAPLSFAKADEDRRSILAQVFEGVRLLITWSPTRE